MSLSKPRVDGREIVTSQEYRALTSYIGDCGVLTLDQAAILWPDYDSIEKFRGGKKRAVGQELTHAANAGGAIRCLSAIVPRRPLVFDQPAGVVPIEQLAGVDFAAIANKIATRLPESIKFDQLNVYTTREKFLSAHRNFEQIAELSRDWVLDRSRLRWYLGHSPLTCRINIAEILIQLMKGGRMFPAVVDKSQQHLQAFRSPPEQADVSMIGRPYAVCGEYPDVGRRIFILGAGLSAEELEHACATLTKHYSFVPDDEHWIGYADRTWIEVW